MGVDVEQAWNQPLTAHIPDSSGALPGQMITAGDDAAVTNADIDLFARPTCPIKDLRPVQYQVPLRIHFRTQRPVDPARMRG